MTPIRKLIGNLPTLEGLTLTIGTEVAVTEEFSVGWKNVRFRIVLVREARYRVREEDLAFALGEV